MSERQSYVAFDISRLPMLAMMEMVSRVWMQSGSLVGL